MPPVTPAAATLQYVWDASAHLAMQGAELSKIVESASRTAAPKIEAETVLEVPSRGRWFWGSLSFAVAWGIVADLALLGIGSLGARPVPALGVIIPVGVLIWAVAFGVMAANRKVRDKRVTLLAQKQTSVRRLARDAALQVWAAQVPGSWQPLGPEVTGAKAAGPGAPAAWLARFGVTDEVVAVLVGGTAAELQAAVQASGRRPVAGFVAEPGVFRDEARELAEELGMALFAIGRTGVHAMSPVGSSVWRAYRDPASTQGPAGELLARWSSSAARR